MNHCGDLRVESWSKYQVQKLMLKTVRYYAGDRLVKTDETPRIVWDNRTVESGTSVP